MKQRRSGVWLGGWLVAVAACSGGQQGGSSSSSSSGGGSSGSSSQGGSAQSSDAGAVQSSDAGTAQASDAGAAQAQAALPPLPAGLHGPSKPWAQMTPEERGHYMADSVVPAMGELLHAYDPNRFAQVSCRTCHGANAREVHFHMPNSLPALPTPGGDAWNQWMQRDPRMFQFMATRVEQAQAQLLGVQPYNMQTNQGFGCFNCHPHGG